MSQSWQALGIDLGLRTGAIARVNTVQLGKRIMLHDSQSIFNNPLGRRNKRKEARPDRTPSGIAALGQEMIRTIRENVPEDLLPGMPVGIDWNFYEGYWGNRRTASEKAFLCGYLYRALLDYGMLPVCLPPAEVRRMLALGKTSPKEQVWDALSTRSIGAPLPVIVSPHEHDAIVLAYLAARMLATGKVQSTWNSRLLGSFTS